MNPQHIFNEALALQKQGDLAAAAGLYRQVLVLDPEAITAWINQGAALQGLGRFREALASYDQAVTRMPTNSAAWYNRALTLLSLIRHAEALESFEKVIAIASGHVDAWRGRAHALLALGFSEEALKSLNRALELAPGHAETMYRRAATLHVDQRFDEALATLDGILAIHRDYPDALALKGAVLCETRHVPEGMACYRRHAEAVFSAQPFANARDPESKRKHDHEQREWMAAHSIGSSAFHIEDGARIAGPAVNKANSRDVERRWREISPQLVVIDNLLTAGALDALRQFCWGSTIWRNAHPNGYLGALPQQGFSCPLLAQIADELREVFPGVIEHNGLGSMWGFKYDSQHSGIPVHADQAKVNVNFWIAPEDANRDAESGGLVVWDVKAPLNWDFSRYNSDEAGIHAFLAGAGARPITIPHRTNRAVIFDSDLFHASDRIHFKDGYENRRINVTMLYGRRTNHGG